MVAEGLQMVEFRAGQQVYGQGDPGDRFYIVREGTGEAAARARVWGKAPRP